MCPLKVVCRADYILKDITDAQAELPWQFCSVSNIPQWRNLHCPTPVAPSTPVSPQPPSGPCNGAPLMQRLPGYPAAPVYARGSSSGSRRGMDDVQGTMLAPTLSGARTPFLTKSQMCAHLIAIKHKTPPMLWYKLRFLISYIGSDVCHLLKVENSILI